MKLQSYDLIVNAINAKETAEAKQKEVSKVAKLKVQSKLRSKKDDTFIALEDAKDKFTAAVISGEDIDKAALELKTAHDTNEFYTELYDSLFPTGN